jgi:hypothetical protein
MRNFAPRGKVTVTWEIPQGDRLIQFFMAILYAVMLFIRLEVILNSQEDKILCLAAILYRVSQKKLTPLLFI